MALAFRLALAHLAQTSKQLLQMADVIQASEELVEEEHGSPRQSQIYEKPVPGSKLPTKQPINASNPSGGVQRNLLNPEAPVRLAPGLLPNEADEISAAPPRPLPNHETMTMSTDVL